MKVVPAILSETFEDCQKMLRQAQSFTDYVQIDLMDGQFVPSRSFPGEDINRIGASPDFEIHMMVRDPASLITRINHPRLKKVIFHFESEVDPLDFIGRMKERGIPTGLAVNPETDLGQFRKISNHVGTLLFLAVDPGHYGSPFRPEVLKKVEKTRQLFPEKIISVDGGVSLENLKLFIEIGVDSVCVGSRIFLRGVPEENYRQFINKIKEWEAVETT